MRVLVVTAWAPWRLSDGGSLVIHHHLRRLALRHDITVFSAGGRIGEGTILDGSALPEGVGGGWFGTRRASVVDYAIRRLRSERSGEPAHVHWVERPQLVSALRRELVQRPPDMLHLHGWGTGQLWRMAPAVPTLHVAVDAWDLGRSSRALPAWRRVADARQRAKVVAHQRRHYPRCGGVVVVGPRDAEHLRQLVPEARVEVVPNGVDAGPEPGPSTERPVLGFHGAFGEHRPNVEAARVLVREVLPLVRLQRPDARALVIGRDPGRDLRALAGDGVEVTGTVSDVRARLADVAVYVAPLVSGTGLRNKVLEAMAARLPVVASPLALEGIGEGGGVFETASPQLMASRIVDLLESREARFAAGCRARHRVMTEFTWEASAASIEALWSELAG